MRQFWDRIGISASLLCVIHCLLTPSLVILLPFLGEALAHGWFHTVIVLIVFPVAVWALWNGFLLHRLKRVLWLGGIGIAFLIAALAFGRDDMRVEFALMIVAGLTLASAHLINLRACRLDHR
ncbi:MAG: MerC domain-containing protein [Bdellovibrionaceae bacterium]|nr:MerC domain-containing protein [Pseudobdellovibrionaceae bacterium]